MNTETVFLTHCTHMPGVDYTFASLVRHLSGEECALLAVEYFEEHRDTTLPGEVLFVDLRPAFQKDLADVTPQFYRAERKTVTPPKLDRARIVLDCRTANDPAMMSSTIFARLCRSTPQLPP